jgi:hypothetical protein
MVKPIYKYWNISFYNSDNIVGYPAYVYVAEDTPHPDSGEFGEHMTSPVVHYDEPTEIYETMNSIYVPA